MTFYNHLEVWPGRIETPDGSTLPFNGKTAIVAAALASDPTGADVKLHGSHMSSPYFGRQKDSSQHYAFRPEPFNMNFIGDADGSTRLMGAALSDKGGGIDHIGFHNITFPPGSFRTIIQDMGTTIGMLEVLDCLFEADPGRQFAVRPYKSRFNIKRNIFKRGREHPFYCQNTDGGTFAHNYAENWGRTMFQAVERYHMYGEGGNSKGDLYIYGNFAKNCGWEGAWNFTIAGHTGGRVFFNLRPNGRIDLNHSETNGLNTGHFVSWMDQQIYDLGKTATLPPNERVPQGPGYAIDAEVKPDGTIVKRGYSTKAIMIAYPSLDMRGVGRTPIAVGRSKYISITSDSRGPGACFSDKPMVDLAHNGTNEEIELIGRESPNDWPFFDLNGNPSQWREGSDVGIDPDQYWTEGGAE